MKNLPLRRRWRNFMFRFPWKCLYCYKPYLIQTQAAWMVRKWPRPELRLMGTKMIWRKTSRKILRLVQLYLCVSYNPSAQSRVSCFSRLIASLHFYNRVMSIEMFMIFCRRNVKSLKKLSTSNKFKKPDEKGTYKLVDCYLVSSSKAQHSIILVGCHEKHEDRSV